jgi:hypothetical protein
MPAKRRSRFFFLKQSNKTACCRVALQEFKLLLITRVHEIRRFVSVRFGTYPKQVQSYMKIYKFVTMAYYFNYQILYTIQSTTFRRLDSVSVFRCYLLTLAQYLEIVSLYFLETEAIY